MVAAGLTVALVDPAIKHRAVPGIVFRPIADRGVFTESGVIYRQDDPSPLLASFLHEVRLTPRRRDESGAVVERRSAVASKPRRVPVRKPRRLARGDGSREPSPARRKKAPGDVSRRIRNVGR